MVLENVDMKNKDLGIDFYSFFKNIANPKKLSCRNYSFSKIDRDFKVDFKNINIADGISLFYMDSYIYSPFYFNMFTEVYDAVEISYTFFGDIKCNFKNYKKEFGTFSGLSNLSFIDYNNLGFELFMNKRQRFKMFKLRFDKESFDDYCQYIGCSLPPNFCSLVNSSKELISQCSLVLSNKIKNIASKIDVELNKFSDNTYNIESLCADFTRGIIEQLYGGFSKINPKRFISYKDIKKVEEAHYIISQNLDNPPKLIDLARRVGLNDYKLKNGFRQAYGMSVHQALKKMRLEKAEEFIKNGIKNVTEAAFSVGYNNIGDFGIAFKKEFGVLPGTLKKMSYSSKI